MRTHHATAEPPPFVTRRQLEPNCLDDLLSSLGLDLSEVCGGGGSNATVCRFQHEGRAHVVKFVRSGTELVDGHDAATLGRKADQIDLIRRCCPQLRDRVVAPVAVYRGDDGCALVMPWVEGTPVAQLLDEAGDPAVFFAALTPILTELFDHGYAVSSTPAPPGTFARLHLDRIERRLNVVRANLDSRLLDGELPINGVRCPKLEDALALLRSSPDLLATLEPPQLTARADVRVCRCHSRSPGTRWTVCTPPTSRSVPRWISSATRCRGWQALPHSRFRPTYWKRATRSRSPGCKPCTKASAANALANRARPPSRSVWWATSRAIPRRRALRRSPPIKVE